MNVSLTVTYGDLSISVEAFDCTTDQASQLLGSACNELLRSNMALTMQATD